MSENAKKCKNATETTKLNLCWIRIKQNAYIEQPNLIQITTQILSMCFDYAHYKRTSEQTIILNIHVNDTDVKYCEFKSLYNIQIGNCSQRRNQAFETTNSKRKSLGYHYKQ